MALVVTLPRTDPGLLAFSLNFSTKITAAPTDYGLLAGDATAYAAVHAAFASALSACDPTSRSKTLTAQKNAARATLKQQLFLLACKVQADASVTDAQKIDLGLAVPTPRQNWPVPADKPALDIIGVSGHTVSTRLHDATDSGHRALPPMVDGASVFSYVGDVPPSDTSAWTFQGTTSRGRFDIVFPNTVPAGATVYLTAFWFNNRKQPGPACDPVAVILAGPNIMVG